MPYVSCTGQFYYSICCLCSFPQKISLEKAPDGVRLFCEPNIHIGCKRIVLFLRSMFKFLCHSQFLEMRATSKKVVLFHDNGFVLLRFGYVTKVHHI